MRIGIRFTADDVVKHLDVENACRFSKLTGDADVRRLEDGSPLVGDDHGDRACDNGSAKDLLRRYECTGGLAEGDEIAIEEMIFAVEIDTVERLLHRILVEGRTQLVGNLGGVVELNLFAE